MSTTDLIIEKVRGLTEMQAQAVLAFVRELSESPSLSATELMRLPRAERQRILTSQARQADQVYRQNPDMLVEDVEAPLNHG